MVIGADLCLVCPVWPQTRVQALAYMGTGHEFCADVQREKSLTLHTDDKARRVRVV